MYSYSYDMEVAPETRPRGRPRNTDADKAIVDATLRLLAEHGYSKCSIEAVADAAGVTRATVYRRYPTKADLVTEAVCTMKELPELDDMSDTRACLTWLMSEFYEGLGRADGVSIVAALYVQRRVHPEMLNRFREQIIFPGRERFLTMMRAGIEHGTVRPDADLELAVDQLTGAFLSRVFTGMEFDDGWAAALVGQVWPGIAAT